MLVLTEIATGVFVATSQFASTNTVVVTGSDGGCLIIDPGVLVAELATLAEQITASGLRVSVAWSTHPHWDHVLWHAALGDAPRYAAPAAVRIAAVERNRMIAGAEQSAPGHNLALFGRLTPLAANAIDWNGPTAELIVHDGHAPGHGAVFLPDTGVIAVGDMCSDVEIPLLDLEGADPLGDYRAGLSLLADMPGVRHVVPGHGHVGGGDEFRRRVAADVAYLDQLVLGRPFDDSRIDKDWLRDCHQDHLRYCQQ
jgi:hydroxyacylglutathione hydrolase